MTAVGLGGPSAPLASPSGAPRPPTRREAPRARDEGPSSAVGDGPPEALARLRSLGRPVHLAVGEALVTEGDAGDAVFVVERGSLLVTRRGGAGAGGLGGPDGEARGADGRPGPTVLGWVGAGDLVGELGVLCGAARCATVTAHTEVLAWRVEGARFVEALRGDPALALALARSVALRARGGDAVGSRQSTLTLYVPRAPAASASVLRESRRFLAGLFGGATMLPATGTWRSERGGLVDDELCLLRVYADARDVARHLPRVRAHARRVRRALGEEAVAIELDGRMELV